MVLPVKGIGLQVNRTYDSFNPVSADFGFSWTYSVSDLGLNVDDQRVQTQGGAIDGTSFSLRTGGSSDAVLTMPDTGQHVAFPLLAVLWLLPSPSGLDAAGVG